MIAIIIVLAGFAVIFGAGGVAAKLTRLAVGLALILSCLPGLLTRARQVLDGAHAPGAQGLTPAIIVILVLSAIGYVAWRLRSFLERRSEATRKRYSSPRERALPPPPAPADEGSA